MLSSLNWLAYSKKAAFEMLEAVLPPVAWMVVTLCGDANCGWTSSLVLRSVPPSSNVLRVKEKGATMSRTELPAPYLK